MYTVLYVFGWLFAALSTSLTLPLAIAVARSETDAAQAFVATALLTAFIGGGLILSAKRGRSVIRRHESLLLAGLIWLIVPLPAALPFYFSGQIDDLLKSYFEAVSAFTTTGATVLTDLSDVPLSILFFRSFLAWLGGLATLLFFGLILGPLTGPERIDPRLRQLNQGQLGSGRHFKEAVYTVFPIYSGLTALCFFALLIAKIPSFDALCLALSTLSTGGFIPRAGTIALYGSSLAELILTIFMFLGAVSIFWIRGLIQMQRSSITRTREPAYIGAAILTFGTIIAVQLLIISPEQGFRAVYHSFTLGLAAAASLISTTGFAISPQTSEVIPYTVLVTMCLVGGGAFSTAGGLKVFRLIAMFEMTARDMRKLIYPHGVLATDKGSLDSSDNTALVLAANFAVVVLAVVALAIILSITDLTFQHAVMASISAIANVGPAFEQVDLPELASDVSYADISQTGLSFLCAGMILGRVEVLALLSLVNFAYWRN